MNHGKQEGNSLLYEALWQHCITLSVNLTCHLAEVLTISSDDISFFVLLNVVG